MRRDARLAVAAAGAVLILGTTAALIAYVLDGTREEQDHRAQIVGTVVATVLIVPTGLAWVWQWIARHQEPAAIPTKPGEHVLDLTGDWVTAWQSFKDGAEVIALQPVRVAQDGDQLQIETQERGRPVEDGGFHWRGQLRLWDNEILMGWYASVDTSVRSKGTMYFVLHPQGRRMAGRWVGLSYDGKIVTGYGAMTRHESEARDVIARLQDGSADAST